MATKALIHFIALERGYERTKTLVSLITHDACHDIQGGASGTGGHATSDVAAVRVREDSDDEFIPFIG